MESDHSTHGRESPEETPNLTHCPCCGYGVEKQAECAAAGCGYCSLLTETPNEIAEKLVMLVGRRTAIDLCAIVPSVTEDPPGKRDLHHRLTEVTDRVLGPVPTMPIEALIERLEKAAPRLQKALEAYEEESDSEPPYDGTPSDDPVVDAIRAYFDPRTTKADVDKAMLVLQRHVRSRPEPTRPFQPTRTGHCDCCYEYMRGGEVPLQRFEHDDEGTIREGWLCEACMLGRGPCRSIKDPSEQIHRPFNNDDPNDGSFKRFTCECGTCIEVTPTWRSLHNNAWWIETFCSEKCGWKARGATLRTWAEDAEKSRG